MYKIFDPETLKQTYRDPLAWIILAVDLFPIWAVLMFGWGAAPLVFLYWLENLILGAVALAKMIAASMKDGAAGGLSMLFLGPFFVFHYGLFCFVHGVFVSTFANFSTDAVPGFPTPVGLVQEALASGINMPIFILAIVALQIVLFVQDFLIRGAYRRTTVTQEMAAPYSRILVLHFALFAGAFAMLALGEPLLGILALILLRAVWGIGLTVRRQLSFERASQLKS